MYIPAYKVHEKMETVTLHGRMRYILHPMEDKGKGVQEEAISKGVGLHFLRSFFLGTLKQELLFLLMIYFTAFINIVYVNVNVIGS